MFIILWVSTRCLHLFLFRSVRQYQFGVPAFQTLVAFRCCPVAGRSVPAAGSEQGWPGSGEVLGLWQPRAKSSSATASYMVTGEPRSARKEQHPSPTRCLSHFIPHKLSEDVAPYFYSAKLNCQSKLRHWSLVILKTGEQQDLLVAEVDTSKLLGAFFPSPVSSHILQLLLPIHSTSSNPPQHSSLLCVELY